jgi:coenzyme F420-dependent oxidoreductase
MGSVYTMTEVDLLLSVSDHSTLDSVAEQAETAESMGFDRVSLGETTGWNAVTTLTLVGERTEHIGISNDVFSPYSRSPALLGQTAAVLQEATGGRYRLGLGPSSPALVEGWHGASFERPLRRLRETIEVIRTVLSGERVAYEGDIFDLNGLSLGCSPPETELPIDVAVLGPKAVELAGRFADGWVPQLFTSDGLRERLDDLERGARLGNRDPNEVRVSPILRCCAMDDGERARERARKSIAFLIGAYGPYYRQSIAEQGYEDIASAIREAWEAGERDRMTEELPDSLLDELVAAGTPDTVRKKVEAFGAITGVDAVRVGFVTRGSVNEQHRTMAALEPLLARSNPIN